MLESYLARQPILDADERLLAYELLYRDDHGGPAEVDGDQATSEVFINSYIEIGLSRLVGRHQAFINVTRDFIINHDQLPPPSNQLVLEVLEDVEADDEVVAAIKLLISKNYQIALDDFDYDQKHRGLLPLAHIVKVDILQHDNAALAVLVTSLRNFPVKILAEKVETIAQYDYCRELGFDYYQGYYLCQPRIVRGQALPANKLQVIQLLGKLQADDTEADDLVAIIEKDVALSYKLLRYINSASIPISRKTESIRHSVIILGQNEVQRWASMIAISNIEAKSSELIRMALLRAKMCELLCIASGQGNPAAAFIVGMFSMLDALMDAPLDELVGTLPIATDLKDALLHNRGPYSVVLDSTLAYEQGRWGEIDGVGLGADVSSYCYLNAVEWSDVSLRQLTEKAA